MECVYEPPQENYPEGFEVSEDPKADTVDALAGLLGLKRVSEGRNQKQGRKRQRPTAGEDSTLCAEMVALLHDFVTAH